MKSFVVLLFSAGSFALSPPWQQLLASPEHTGISTNSIHAAPCGPQWSAQVSSQSLQSSTVVTSMLMGTQTVVDGVAILSNEGMVNMIVNGIPRWTFNTFYSFSAGSVPPTPAFNPTGDTLFVASGRRIYALNASSGLPIWVTNLTDVLSFSVVIDSNVLAIAGGSTIYLFDPTAQGSNYSTFIANDTISAPPVIDSLNDEIFFVTGGTVTYLNKISKFGLLLIQIPLTGPVTSSLLISSTSRSVYLISTTGVLQGYTLDTLTSKCQAPATVIPSYIPNLSISFASILNDVIAIPVTGGITFSLQCIYASQGTFLGYTPSTSFASDGSSLVFGTSDGRLVSVNVSNFVPSFPIIFVANISASGAAGPSIVSSPSVGKNGTIYVGSSSGNIVSFGDLICPAGSFVNGNVGCSLCPAGSYSTTSNSAPQICTLCLPGTFSTTIGATSNATCINCPKGQFSNSSGATSCKDCPPGSFNSAGQGTTQCPACASSCYCPAGSEVDCPSLMVYPMFAVNQLHTGLSPFQGPLGFPVVSLLPFSTGQSSLPASALIIGPQGGIIPPNSPQSDLIFLGMSDDVFAVSGTNQALINNYDVPSGQSYDSQPVLAPWGILYIMSSTYTLYALPWNTGGPPLWSVPTITTSYTKVPSNYTRTPLSINVALGTVVFSAGGSIYSVNGFNGTVVWSFIMSSDPLSDGVCLPSPCPIAVLTTPAVSPDGSLVFFGGDDTLAYALHAQTGIVAWDYQARGKVRGSPTLNADGSLVYISSDENNLLVLVASTGIINWLTPVATTSSVRTAPCLSNDGVTAYVGALDGTFFASNFNSPKSISWQILLDGSVNASATVDSNNVVFVGTSAGSLYSINASTGVILWKATIGEPIVTAPVVDANGAVLIPSFKSSSYYSVVGSVPTATPSPTATSSASSSATGTTSSFATATTSATPTSTASATTSATASSTASSSPSTSPSTRTPSPTAPSSGDNSASIKLTNTDVIALATAVPSIVVFLCLILCFYIQRSRVFSRRPKVKYNEGENYPLRRGLDNTGLLQQEQRRDNVSVNLD